MNFSSFGRLIDSAVTSFKSINKNQNGLFRPNNYNRYQNGINNGMYPPPNGMYPPPNGMYPPPNGMYPPNSGMHHPNNQNMNQTVMNQQSMLPRSNNYYINQVKSFLFKQY